MARYSRRESMSWINDKEQLDEFIKEVRMPGEEAQGFDDGYDYYEMVEYAKSLGEEGVPLLKALEKKAAVESTGTIAKTRTFRQVLSG